ncbi:penicillin-binding protein [Terribacillus aidingensis]|uniref:serine-type D-Ala-D-Ala carboxypeptidase n=1 Tax=Terribacillus aidingensis TaxID=586416 RepID=A0A285MYS6_9BACI|nr:penicillin-binding transpeptidase domain-containing protein [Terribacillus aidingensis]SNZ02345.1 penicillin-binding protein [Terribacillus aidingensis]
MKRLAAVLFIVSALFLLSACSDDQSAKDGLNQFVDNWNAQDFDKMYSQLTEESQQDITKEEFVKRYTDIYEQTGVTDLKVKVGEVSEEEAKSDADTQQLPLSVSMQTVAGEVAFDKDAELVKVDGEDGAAWKINWDPSYIFAQLNGEESVRISSIEPERGRILDVNGEELAFNATVPSIGLIPGQLEGDGKTKDETLNQVAEILEMDREEIDSLLEQSWVTDEVNVPIKTLRPDQRDLAKKVTTLPGVQSTETTSRFYPLGEAAAHLTGYVKKVDAEFLEKDDNASNYSSTSYLGSTGLESVFEDKLRGKIGWKIYTDSSEEQEIIAETEVQNGEDVETTIDSNTQKEIYNQLKEDSGASAAIDPKTGATLALVSTPSYDPNNFIFGWDAEEYEKLSNDENSPFTAKFNKTYAPGSTIKPLTAAVGLENGVISPDEAKHIEGKTWNNDGKFGDYSVTRVSSSLTDVDLENALITSDNIYFAMTAVDTGAENFQKGLESFGFDEELDYAFPTKASSVSNDGLNSETLLADSGYGQGQVLMSPLHLAAAYTPFLNDGDLIKPTLQKTKAAEPTVWHEDVLPADGANAITEGLRGVVEDERGSAHQPVVGGLTIAGKTGTAELKQSKDDENGKENGWFVAYDYDKQDMLISMMIEDVKGKGGSHYTVEKVKNIFK